MAPDLTSEHPRRMDADVDVDVDVDAPGWLQMRRERVMA